MRNVSVVGQEDPNVHLHKSSNLSVRIANRHPSLQLSIAEDDEEWTSELGGQLSPDAEENMGSCELLSRELAAAQLEVGDAHQEDAASHLPSESTFAPSNKKIGPADFHLLCVVGQGSFGKVELRMIICTNRTFGFSIGVLHISPKPAGLEGDMSTGKENEVTTSRNSCVTCVHTPFMKVFQVRKKDTGQIYAMKVMRKERILEKDHAAYVWSERDVLTSLNHPYIVRMLYAFQVLDLAICSPSVASTVLQPCIFVVCSLTASELFLCF